MNPNPTIGGIDEETGRYFYQIKLFGIKCLCDFDQQEMFRWVSWYRDGCLKKRNYQRKKRLQKIDTKYNL